MTVGLDIHLTGKVPLHPGAHSLASCADNEVYDLGIALNPAKPGKEPEGQFEGAKKQNMCTRDRLTDVKSIIVALQ